MEQSKHSEEEILKLGKKLVEELNLYDGVDTLGKWMANYLAELITKAESCDPKKEKEIKKECFDTILLLWKNRRNASERIQPTSDLKPLLKVIEAFKDRSGEPLWMRRNNSEDDPLGEFLESLKSKTEYVFELSILYTAANEIFDSSQEWLENYEEFLSEDERNIIEYFQVVFNKSNSPSFLDDMLKEKVKPQDLSSKERSKLILDKIETQVTSMTNEFEKLKEIINQESPNTL